MNHPAFTPVKWSMLLLGIALIVGAPYLLEDDRFVLYLAGGIFAATGAVIVLYTHWSQQKAAHLRQSGQLVQANFQQVERNTGITVNGAHPFRIVVQWQDHSTQALHIFKSANLWFDPSQFVQNRTIPVYIDIHNPRNYLVDVSFLPKVQGIV